MHTSFHTASILNMEDEKDIAHTGPVEEISDDVARNFTHNDQRDMKRMGKKQELLRNFRILTCTYIAGLQGKTPKLEAWSLLDFWAIR